MRGFPALVPLVATTRGVPTNFPRRVRRRSKAVQAGAPLQCENFIGYSEKVVCPDKRCGSQDSGAILSTD